MKIKKSSKSLWMIQKRDLKMLLMMSKPKLMINNNSLNKLRNCKMKLLKKTDWSKSVLMI